MKKVNDLLSYELKKDTRDDSDLHVYTIKNKLSKDDYIKLNQTLKKEGCYYSRFVKGFICKTVLKNDIDFIETIKTKSNNNNKSNKIEYHKNLLNYISIDEYKQFLRDYAKNNLYKSWTYRHTTFKNDSEALEMYQKELLGNLEQSMKYNSFGELDYIREAIIHKSLGYNVNDFRANSYEKLYIAIWDKLPIIKGLKVTDESYSAMWGYDQTNIDIAYRLNKKLWGLDAFVITTVKSKYMLVRMKDGRFHDKVRYFSRDLRPQETFKNDASQTGQYR